MASAFKISTAARNAAVNGVVDLIDAGSAAGKILIFEEAPPTNVSDADPATKLGELTFGDPAFGNASGGTAASNAITSDADADDSGDAGSFRVKDSDNNVIFQGTAGEAGDTPDMVFDNKTIVAGGTIAIDVGDMTVTQPIGP